MEQDIDIEVNDLEPSFLAGQTKITLELSPVKIVKAPDGYVDFIALPRTALSLAGRSTVRRKRERLWRRSEKISNGWSRMKPRIPKLEMSINRGWTPWRNRMIANSLRMLKSIRWANEAPRCLHGRLPIRSLHMGKSHP